MIWPNNQLGEMPLDETTRRQNDASPRDTDFKAANAIKIDKFRQQHFLGRMDDTSFQRSWVFNTQTQYWAAVNAIKPFLAPTVDAQTQ
jgi:hypothetical protein